MPIIKHAANADVRVISIDIVRLVEGPHIDQCFREIAEVIDKTQESCLLLHFGRVAFLSSAALGLLVRVLKKCKQYNIDLKLCNIATEIREVFKITAMDKIFDIHDDAAKAMAAFQKSGRLFYRRNNPTSYEVKD